MTLTPSVCQDMRAIYARMVLDLLLNSGKHIFPNPNDPQALEVVLGGVVDGVKMFEAHVDIPLIDTLASIALDYKESVNE